MHYYAEITNLDKTVAKIAVSTVSHEAAIRNAVRRIKRFAESRGVIFEPGEPNWMSGCLTWNFVQGFTVGADVFWIVANEMMTTEEV